MLMNIAGVICFLVVAGMMVLAKVCMKPVQKEQKKETGKTGERLK